MDFEVINEKVGGCGLYHYIAFFLLALPTFKQAVDYQGLTFALYEPKFWCDNSKKAILSSGLNSSGNYSELYVVSKDQCTFLRVNSSLKQPCTKWTYDKKTFASSLITEFDLVCSRKYLKDIIYSIHFVGELIGFPIAISSDMFGRRFLLLSSLYLSIPNTLLQSLSYNIWVQMITTLIGGCIRSLSIMLAYVTLVELMPIQYLDLAATNFFIFYSFGYMATAGFAYFTRVWRMISFLSLIPTVTFLLYLCFIPETPRWLMLSGRREESYKTMAFIGKINGHKLQRKDFDNWNPVQEVTGQFWNLFKYKKMILRCLLLTFAAWTFSFAYIASSTDLKFASNNIFITTLVMGMVEIPTGPLAAIMARSLGRKKGISSLCGLGIVCLIVMPFIEDDSSVSTWQPWLKIVLAMGAKLGFTSAWCVFDVVTNELIPTSVRNGGMGIIYTSVCVGGMLAPMLHDMALEWHYSAACLIYASLLIATVILVMVFLPETKNLPLPQTMEQAVALEMGKEEEWKAWLTEEANIRGKSENRDDRL